MPNIYIVKSQFEYNVSQHRNEISNNFDAGLYFRKKVRNIIFNKENVLKNVKKHCDQ